MQYSPQPVPFGQGSPYSSGVVAWQVKMFALVSSSFAGSHCCTYFWQSVWASHLSAHLLSTQVLLATHFEGSHFASHLPSRMTPPTHLLPVPASTGGGGGGGGGGEHATPTRRRRGARVFFTGEFLPVGQKD